MKRLQITDYKSQVHGIFGTLLLVATSCGSGQTGKEVQPVQVRTMKMELRQTDGGQHYSGTVEEASGTTLSFPVGGTVREIRVEAGQRVSRGELIASLGEVALRSDYESAAAAREQAEDAYGRMEQLHKAGSLPEMQWVEVQSRLKQAQSAERIAKKNLEDGRLTAPFAGVIAEKNVEAGQNVMPNQPVARLVTVSRVKVSVAVPEQEIARIAMGQTVNVTVSALGDRRFTGRVVERGIAANPVSRSYEVKALIENPAGELLPGMICTMVAPLTSCFANAENPPKGGTQEVSSQKLVVRSNVIQTDEANRTFVWVNEQGVARKRIIEVGSLGREEVEVSAGLAVGDEVIVEGGQKVSDGTRLSVSYQ